MFIEYGFRNVLRVVLVICTSFFMNVPTIMSQELSLSADVVSSYVWRGQYQYNNGPSIQPSLFLTMNGFSFGFWGSTDFQSAKEFDMQLTYSRNNFTIGVCDYWWNGQLGNGLSDNHYFSYRNKYTSHLVEVLLSYQFGETFPLSLSWNTMLYGADKAEEGNAMYSSYAEIAYSAQLKGVDLDFGVGFVPYKSLLYNSNAFSVTNIYLKGSKSVPITDKYVLPIFVQAIFNPRSEDCHLVFGISF